ncbi:MAG: hypothetical protein ACYS8Z_15360 [Planctomycetota bacterium]|jgi:predicted nuclease with TOPRIM domain
MAKAKPKPISVDKIVKDRITEYSTRIEDVHKKLAALEEEKTKLNDLGKQLVGAINAMQELLRETDDVYVASQRGVEPCTAAKQFSA